MTPVLLMVPTDEVLRTRQVNDNSNLLAGVGELGQKIAYFPSSTTSLEFDLIEGLLLLLWRLCPKNSCDSLLSLD